MSKPLYISCCNSCYAMDTWVRSLECIWDFLQVLVIVISCCCFFSLCMPVHVIVSTCALYLWNLALIHGLDLLWLFFVWLFHFLKITDSFILLYLSCVHPDWLLNHLWKSSIWSLTLFEKNTLNSLSILAISVSIFVLVFRSWVCGSVVWCCFCVFCCALCMY